jgi:8-amino-7-oxononanoate synthase
LFFNCTYPFNKHHLPLSYRLRPDTEWRLKVASIHIFKGEFRIMSASFMNNQQFEPYWPVKAMREQDVYFYNEAIESYEPNCRVMVEGHGEMLLLGSYSYLGLNNHPKINQAAKEAIEIYGTGTHGARLLAGTLTIHKQLEKRIANIKGAETAVTFTSGYTTNLATIAALVGRHDTVFCDMLNHASIVDGCLFSQARLVRFQHNDMDHLETCLKDPTNSGRKLVVVDAVFSMDGDVVNLPEVSRLCREYGALLLVDEAHSIGVLGQTGHGIEEHFNFPADRIDIKMGTFNKAIPSIGGYIASNESLGDLLRHQARSFVYSSALPPAAAAATLAALDIIETEPQHVQRLQKNTHYFAQRLRQTGIPFLNSITPIFPIICGDDWQAWRLARYCQKQGIYIQAIPSPAVPKGTARLRAVISAAHRQEDLDYCIDVLLRGIIEMGGILGQTTLFTTEEMAAMR